MNAIDKMFHKDFWNTVKELDITDYDLQIIFSKVRNLAIKKLIVDSYSKDTLSDYVTSTHIIQRWKL